MQKEEPSSTIRKSQPIQKSQQCNMTDLSEDNENAQINDKSINNVQSKDNQVKKKKKQAVGIHK